MRHRKGHALRRRYGRADARDVDAYTSDPARYAKGMIEHLRRVRRVPDAVLRVAGTRITWGQP